MISIRTPENDNLSRGPARAQSNGPEWSERRLMWVPIKPTHHPWQNGPTIILINTFHKGNANAIIRLVVGAGYILSLSLYGLVSAPVSLWCQCHHHLLIIYSEFLEEFLNIKFNSLYLSMFIMYQKTLFIIKINKAYKYINVL